MIFKLYLYSIVLILIVVIPYALAGGFGNTAVGGSTDDIEDIIKGSNFTAPENATVSNITAYMQMDAGGHTVKCAIYQKSNSALIGNTTPKVVGTAAAWTTFIFPEPKPNITNQTNYALVCWTDDLGGSSYFYYTSASSRSVRDFQSYGDWPDPADFTVENSLFSIYANWSDAAAPPADTCTPPASGNYAVTASDNCDWTTNDEIPANISITGSGEVTLSANWTFTSTNQYIFIGPDINFTILPGGSLNG